MILVTGAGGFIGGHLVDYLLKKGYNVVAVDKKNPTDWFQWHKEAKNIRADLRIERSCISVCQGINTVYHLAADIGGAGFMAEHRIACMENTLIDIYMLRAASTNVQSFFFASSSCVYPTFAVTSSKEEDAFPAYAERGYGWQKLYSEMICQEYWKEKKFPIYIARFQNIYGPFGPWYGGREKAPEALCRKVAEADIYHKELIEVWGDGTQERNFVYVNDCVFGITEILKHPELIAKPVNIGSSSSISIEELLILIEKISGKRVQRKYIFDAPQGIHFKSSDNSFLKSVLNWEPSYRLWDGLDNTYNYIYNEVLKSKA